MDSLEGSLADPGAEQLPDDIALEKDVSLFSMPSELSSPVWGALCDRMLTDIHRNHMMTAEEKEKQLKFIRLPLLGDPPGRVISVAEDPTGAYAVGATGSVLWPAAVCLIEQLDKMLPAASSVRSIELGAGLGCVGTFLCRHKGHCVVLTDVPAALTLLQRNVDENFEEGHGPEVLPLHWGDTDQIRLLTAGGAYDLVVGSDITYRPDYIDDLLISAHALLAPGGRVHIALQNRPGEIDSLHSAISRSPLRTISCIEAPPPSCHVKAGSTLEEGAIRWHGYKSPDLISEVFLLELEAKPTDGAPTEASTLAHNFLPSTFEEVEAEFFRITGIKPDPSLRPQYQNHNAPEPMESGPCTGEAPTRSGIGNKSLGQKSKELKKAIIQEYLDRGLDDLLCDMDEDVSAAVAAMKVEDRPKSAKQKKDFVHAFYSRNRAQESIAEVPEAHREDVNLKNASTNSLEDSPQKTDAEVKRCMDGIVWDVVLDYDNGKLIATVQFREELWDMLQGMSSSKSSFRDAVNFELSDSDLRVTYMESPVLELRLPQTVNPAEAGAKLSSKQRRVLVNAPLC